MSAPDGEFNRSLRPNLSSGAFIGGSQGSHDWLTLWVRSMTGQLVGTPCDSLMEAAEKELIAFERNALVAASFISRMSNVSCDA
jgi:hypothetical protein